MRHAVWGLGVLLLFSLSQPVCADKKADQGNWFTRLFSGKTAKNEPKKVQRDTKPTPPRADSPSSKARISAAKTAYFRRLEVCDKLKGLAVQAGDDALLRRAEQLEVRVWDSYQDQLKGLAQNRPALSAEELVLDEHLGIEAGARPRTSLPADTGAIRSVPGSGLAGRK